MQENIWEKEYKNPKLVTGHDKPQSFFLKFLKFLKKDQKIELKGLNILDLGCGTGRNSNYLAKKGAKVTGLEISGTALKIARDRANKAGLVVNYVEHNIGSNYPFEDGSFDLVIDITSSNSLNEEERNIYLSEVARVLRTGATKTFGSGKGLFFVRALCKDGDKNARYLLKNNPAKEKDTYIMPNTGLRERVFSKDDFTETYSKYFKILKLEKTESYSTVGDRLYKRNFWLGILEK